MLGEELNLVSILLCWQCLYIVSEKPVMKTLSKEEKNIIKLIQERKIIDIYSYIKYFNLGNFMQHQKDEIKRKFDEKYGDKECTLYNINFELIKNKDAIVEIIDKKTARMRPFLSYHTRFDDRPDWDYIGYGEIQYYYQITEPIYVCENIEAILHFISVWQYLVSEQMVIELPKSCEKQDMELFLRKDFSQDYSSDFELENVRNYHDLAISPREFMDWRLKLDKHNFELCLPYLTKQIQPTLALEVFIHDKYKTSADKKEDRNFKIALVGVIVAIVTSVTSLMGSIFGNGNAKELQDINNSLQKIQNTLITEEQQQESTAEELTTED